MVKYTRNVLSPKDVLHVYEVYEDGTDCLVETLPAKYVIMGREFATVGEIAKRFGMPSGWQYTRISRYWKSPHGFPDTWRELVGEEAFDPKAIEEAKIATHEAAEEIIRSRVKNLSHLSLTVVLTRHRRLSRLFVPEVMGLR
jgi:hypothetical protein